MSGNAKSTDAVVECAGFAFGERNQFFNTGDRQRGMYNDNHRLSYRQCDGSKIPERIPSGAPAQKWPQPHRAGVAQQAVTIRRRPGCDLICNNAAAVVDNDLLFPCASQSLRHETRDDVAAATRFGGDDAYGFPGIFLRSQLSYGPCRDRNRP